MGTPPSHLKISFRAWPTGVAFICDEIGTLKIKPTAIGLRAFSVTFNKEIYAIAEKERYWGYIRQWLISGRIGIKLTMVYSDTLAVIALGTDENFNINTDFVVDFVLWDKINN